MVLKPSTIYSNAHVSLLKTCIHICICQLKFSCKREVLPIFKTHISTYISSTSSMKTDAIELGLATKGSTPKGTRGLSVLDFILRLVALVGTLVSAILMGTTDETLPFVTQFIRFRAEYDDFSTFTYFVVANIVVAGYLLLSLPLSIINIVRSSAKTRRVILIIFDTAMLSLLTAGASAAAAIIYLAHNGNTNANWFAICQQFNSFCERTSGSLIGSFVGVAVFILLILMSAAALFRKN